MPDIVYISGSPRKKSNTEILMKEVMAVTGGRLIKLSHYEIKPCSSCWVCLRTGNCALHDDMSNTIVPMLCESEGIVIGSPVFFNNVSAQVKAFMDRTWYIRGKLRNKIGGAIVVGRKYGAEGAITAINAFFLKHEMIIANRGIEGIAFHKGEIEKDHEAITAARKLWIRINELKEILKD
jgi:multimeric flavodoxin WrbA